MLGVDCRLSSVEFEVLGVECQVSSVEFEVLGVECQVSSTSVDGIEPVDTSFIDCMVPSELLKTPLTCRVCSL